MHALLEMIDEKQRLVRILNEYIDGTGLTVVIGAEHLEPSLRPFSLVACTFKDGTACFHPDTFNSSIRMAEPRKAVRANCPNEKTMVFETQS